MQELINKAILASVAARREWDLKPVQDRAQVLFKAADVISGPKRAEILAKTMVGQVQETRNNFLSLLIRDRQSLPVNPPSYEPTPDNKDSVLCPLSVAC